MTTTLVQQPQHEIMVGETRLTLLGTAHISQSSVDAVKALLNSGVYDAVAVELCPSRHNALINPDALAKMDLLQVFRSGKTTLVIANLALSAYQQRLAEEIGIEPGAEMRMAVDLACAAHLPVLLIDREIGTTLKRLYHNVPFWRRIYVLAGLLSSVLYTNKVTADDIERLKEGDLLETAFAHVSPNEREIFRPLIDERDQYMVARLRHEIGNSHYRHVLAVVGAGHLKGMHHLFSQELPHPLATIQGLDAIPAPGPWPKVIPWLIVVLILGGFLIGFSQNSDLGWAMVYDWIIINGTFTAVGTLVAGAHPLTILAGFLSAPLTTLHPALGAGMVTGMVEAYLRKPQVGDFIQLRKDTAHLKGWWHNKVARVLLVFFMSTVGAVAGVYTAGYQIYSRLNGG